jgi:5-methylcytosine-specific restriction endonuclease McrA
MKFKATASLQFEFDETSAENTIQRASKYLREKLPTGMAFRVTKVRESSNQNVVLGLFSIESVLPFITKDNVKKEYVVNGETYQVRMNSQRYFVFQKSIKCAACGLEGTCFALEQHPDDKAPHFNLYAEEEGALVLMTKDHIVPKSLGGLSEINNYNTFCMVCNNLKGNSLISPEHIGIVRKLYNVNKYIMTRRQLNAMIVAAKEKYLSSPILVNS